MVCGGVRSFWRRMALSRDEKLNLMFMMSDVIAFPFQHQRVHTLYANLRTALTTQNNNKQYRDEVIRDFDHYKSVELPLEVKHYERLLSLDHYYTLEQERLNVRLEMIGKDDRDEIPITILISEATRALMDATKQVESKQLKQNEAERKEQQNQTPSFVTETGSPHLKSKLPPIVEEPVSDELTDDVKGDESCIDHVKREESGIDHEKRIDHVKRDESVEPRHMIPVEKGPVYVDIARRQHDGKPMGKDNKHEERKQNKQQVVFKNSNEKNEFRVHIVRSSSSLSLDVQEQLTQEVKKSMRIIPFKAKRRF